MMHIILSGDRSVMLGIEVVIYSTMFHNRNTPIHWHVFSMDIDVQNDAEGWGRHYVGIHEEDEQWLRHIVKFMDVNSELTVHNVYDLYMDELSESVNKFTYFSPYTALRLLADLVLPDVDQSWYLDADILVQGDITDIYYSLLRKNRDYNYAAYAVPEAREWAGEMCAGVLILNLNEARRNGWLKRARFNYNRNLYKYPDQMALDEASDFYHLDETYDYLMDHRTAIYKPKILHFTNGNEKIYDSNVGVERFYKYWPEHKYIKDGLKIVRELFNRDKLLNYRGCYYDIH